MLNVEVNAEVKVGIQNSDFSIQHSALQVTTLPPSRLALVDSELGQHPRDVRDHRFRDRRRSTASLGRR